MSLGAEAGKIERMATALFLVLLAQASVPERIVSLAPSTTEILFALQLGEKVVAVTTHCDYPDEAERKPKIGSWANPELELIIARSPDLVVAVETLANERLLKRLKALKVPVLACQTKTLREIYNAIERIALSTGVPQRGKALVKEMRAKLNAIAQKVKGLPRTKLAFVVGHRDLVVVAGGSFLNELIKIAGGENIAGGDPRPYIRYSYEKIIKSAPSVIIDTAMGTELMSREQALKLWSRWKSIPAVRQGRIYGLESGIVLRPGPRVVQTAKALLKILHPETTPKAGVNE